MFKMRTQTDVGLHVKRLLFVYDFNQDKNVFKCFCKSSPYLTVIEELLERKVAAPV
jgi:hypothetical protein